jgi:alcohol dehydrogenase class IV/quinol monooxygenase YgiN
MIVATVDVCLKPEHINEFIKATIANHEASVKEVGNMRFDVLQSAEDPANFLLYEAYQNEEQAAAHKMTAHYATWKETVAPWMAQPRTATPYNSIRPCHPLDRCSHRVDHPMIQPFRFSRIPQLVFGGESVKKLGSAVSPSGRRALLVTGGKSAESSGALAAALTSLKRCDVAAERVAVRGEPSPEVVDEITRTFRQKQIQCVVAIGGGSAIDTAKAVAAMLTVEGSVVEYLEDVGSGTHPGTTLPVIAVPTTAGTGSEATKNAVISRVGENGFKKSLRHDNFVPVMAIVDPCLTMNCTPDITAACGMDAFTQLLESYVSTNANPMTDALALSGIELMAGALLSLVTDNQKNMEKRSAVSYAAFLSGVTLANAGLGVVHGIRSEERRVGKECRCSCRSRWSPYH